MANLDHNRYVLAEELYELQTTNLDPKHFEKELKGMQDLKDTKLKELEAKKFKVFETMQDQISL